MNRPTIRLGAWLLMMLFLMVGISGCVPLVRDRTLPPSIRAVYVPMIVNRTAEPGLEERLTVSVQEEILADGRLNLTSQRKADALVEITLSDFTRSPSGFDVDDFPTSQFYRLEARMSVLENIPGKPMIGGIRRITKDHYFNADPRTTTFDPEPATKEVLFREMARDIVLELLTGDYEDVELKRREEDSDRQSTPRMMFGR